jgi:hypothetical protein
MARAEGRAARWLLAAGLSGLAHFAVAQMPPPGVASAASPTWVAVWVDLDVPELASLPADRPLEREALALKIRTQQDEVMARLRELGAVEQARIQQVRNTLAVRLPGAQLDAARRIPGVRAVRKVRNVDRGPLVHGD